LPNVECFEFSCEDNEKQSDQNESAISPLGKTVVHLWKDETACDTSLVYTV
jgi:hypothetical protein